MYRSTEQGSTRKRFLWILMAPCEITTWNYPKIVKTVKSNFLPLRVSRYRNLISLNSLKIFFKFLQHLFLEDFLKFQQIFSENFLKGLVNRSIKCYLAIAQILVIVYPTFLENFLFFVEFPHISFNISSYLNIFAIS